MSGQPSAARTGTLFGALLAPSFIALGAPTVALPSLADGLHVPFGQTSWVLTSWALMSAVAMPLFGALSGRVGLRMGVVGGVVLIAVGSLIAAVSPDLVLMIVGRAIGGAGAGATVVTAYAIISARLEGEDRSRALGVVAAVGAAASGSGALLGGLLTSGPGWRLVIAAPAVAVVALVPAARLAPSQRDPGRRVDLVGAALLTVVGAAVIVLLQAAATSLPAGVTAGVGVLGVAAAILLRGHVRRRPEGFLPQRVLVAPGFLTTGLVGLTVFAAYYATLFAVPALLRADTGWGAVAVGAALLPAALFSVVGGRLAPRLARRTSVASLAVMIAVGAAAGLLIAACLPGAALRVLGLGLTAGAFAAGQAVLIGAVPDLVERRDADVAQGLFDFIAYGGSSIGPAVVGGLSTSLDLAQALTVAAAVPVVGVLAGVALKRRRVPARSPRLTPPPATPTGTDCSNPRMRCNL